MTTFEKVSESTLRITRTYAAPRDLVFQAWTNPEMLIKWWGTSNADTAPVADIDLRVGGRYRLGMKGPDSDHVNIVGGTYREVRAPGKLVFTWVWEHPGQGDAPPPQADAGSVVSPGETLVTIEFHDIGNQTELVLTHEYFPDTNMRDEHSKGWTGALTQLSSLLEGGER